MLIFGEIRDTDSARAALKFAESGHLVLATLHAKSAGQSVERLLSMLPEADRTEAAFVLATTLQIVINQVLFSKLCDCSISSSEVIDALNERAEDLASTYVGHAISAGHRAAMRHAKGCLRCDNTGYRGRVVVHETIIVDIPDEERLAAANAVAKSGSIGGFLSADGVKWLHRKDVASSLLACGLIDVPTALLAVDAKVVVEHDEVVQA